MRFSPFFSLQFLSRCKNDNQISETRGYISIAAILLLGDDSRRKCDPESSYTVLRNARDYYLTRIEHILCTAKYSFEKLDWKHWRFRKSRLRQILHIDICMKNNYSELLRSRTALSARNSFIKIATVKQIVYSNVF